MTGCELDLDTRCFSLSGKVIILKKTTVCAIGLRSLAKLLIYT